MKGTGGTGIVVVWLGILLLFAVMLLGLGGLMGPDSTYREVHELNLAPGAAEGRPVPANYAGDTLKVTYSSSGEVDSAVTVVLCNKTVFAKWWDNSSAGMPWDEERAEDEDGMFHMSRGGDGSLTIRLDGRRPIVGVHNTGEDNCTVSVAIDVTSDPQYICYCFMVPTLLIASAAAWGAVRESERRKALGDSLAHPEYARSEPELPPGEPVAERRVRPGPEDGHRRNPRSGKSGRGRRGPGRGPPPPPPGYYPSQPPLWDED